MTSRTIRHRRARSPAGPTPMTRTIARIIAETFARTGRAPTDETLAKLLAIHPTRIRHHRNLLGR